MQATSRELQHLLQTPTLTALKDRMLFARQEAEKSGRSYMWYKNVNATLLVSVVVMSLVSSITELAEKSQATVTVLSVLSATIIAVYKGFGLADRENRHNTAATDFSEVSQSIDVEFALIPSGEQTFRSENEFLKRVQARLDFILSRS
jgi:hypothetical protein